jgi:hypothetical protein
MTATQATHHDWRSGEARRVAALAEIDSHLDNVRACVRWLVSQGVYIQDVKLGAHNRRPRITVAASPLLHALFTEDCASGQHWDPLLGRTAHDYVAIRYECEIRWSEVKS